MKSSQNDFRKLFVLVALPILMACTPTVDAGSIQFPDVPAPQGIQVEGLWRTDCVVIAGTSVYTIQSVQFTGSSMKTLADIYTSSSCATRYPGTGTSESNGTFAMAGSSAWVVDAMNLNYTLTDKDSGQSETFYDLVLVEGNNLFLGATKGATSSSRPTSIDRSLVFKKR